MSVMIVEGYGLYFEYDKFVVIISNGFFDIMGVNVVVVGFNF